MMDNGFRSKTTVKEGGEVEEDVVEVEVVGEVMTDDAALRGADEADEEL